MIHHLLLSPRVGVRNSYLSPAIYTTSSSAAAAPFYLSLQITICVLSYRMVQLLSMSFDKRRLVLSCNKQLHQLLPRHEQSSSKRPRRELCGLCLG